MLPLPVRVELGAIAKKEYSAFGKAPGMEPHHQIFCVIIRTPVGGGGSYHCAKMQSVYYIAPVDGARLGLVVLCSGKKESPPHGKILILNFSTKGKYATDLLISKVLV